ncbi:MAG: hypothetical protein V1782_13030 [Pseudomonadota bacterium]
MVCNFIQQCTFFAVRDEGKEMREYLTGFYCAGNFHACARHKATLEMGQELVPDDMFPNENDFLSLFAWSAQQRKIPAGKTCRTRGSSRQPVSTPKKTSASSGHPPSTRHTRNHR